MSESALTVLRRVESKLRRLRADALGRAVHLESFESRDPVKVIGIVEHRAEAQAYGHAAQIVTNELQDISDAVD